MIYPTEVIALMFLFFILLGFALGWFFRGDYDESIEKRAQELRDRDIEKRKMEYLGFGMDSDLPTKDNK
jgi:hypothetical protein